MQCLECGKTFRPSGRGSKQRYCSQACRSKAYRNRKRKQTQGEPAPQTDKEKNEGSGQLQELTAETFEQMRDYTYAEALRKNRDILFKMLISPDTPATAISAISRQHLSVVKELENLDNQSAAKRLEKITGVKLEGGKIDRPFNPATI